MAISRSTRVLELVVEPQECPAYILAGGRSSRFGSDKALVQVGTQSLLEVLKCSLEKHGHSVNIIADRVDRYSQLGMVCLVDRELDCGPLAGIAAALEHRLASNDGWCLLLNCDQWLWRREWFRALSSQVTQDCDALGFASESALHSAIEPLPSMLHTRLIGDVMRRLELKKLPLRDLLNAARTTPVKIESGPKLWTFNTPAELDELLNRSDARDLC